MLSWTGKNNFKRANFLSEEKEMFEFMIQFHSRDPQNTRMFTFANIILIVESERYINTALPAWNCVYI